MPFEPTRQGTGEFVKLRDLAGTVFHVVAVRGPMEGKFGNEFKVDIVDEAGEEKTVSVQVDGSSRVQWLEEAQDYLSDNPKETIPTTVVKVALKNGNTFFQIETQYE